MENVHSEIMHTARWGLAFSESDSCAELCPGGRNVDNERKKCHLTPLSRCSSHCTDFHETLNCSVSFNGDLSTPTAPNFIQICQDMWEIRLTSLSEVCY